MYKVYSTEAYDSKIIITKVKGKILRKKIERKKSALTFREWEKKQEQAADFLG